MTREQLLADIEKYLKEMEPMIKQSGTSMIVLTIKKCKDPEHPDQSHLEAHAFVAAIYNTTYASLMKVHRLLPQWKWDNYKMLGGEAEAFREVKMFRVAMKNFRMSIRKPNKHFMKAKDNASAETN